MPRDVELLPGDPRVLLAIAVCVACAAVWAWAVVRWFHRLPLLPFQRRRPVPWRGVDVALMAMAYFLVPALVVQASKTGLDLPETVESEPAEQPPLDKSHAIEQVLSEKSPSRWPIVLGAVLAIVVAPITEELLFRLLLQGWLESLERRMRRRMPRLRRIVVGVLPVVTVATLFAAVHIRTSEHRQELSALVVQLQLFAVDSLIVIALLVGWLKYAAGATLADFGVAPGKLADDVRLGLLAFFAVTPPVYAILLAVDRLLPENSVADPIPLLFLGLALGGLYYRTHRIVPSIVMHAAFNAVAVLSVLTAP